MLRKIFITVSITVSCIALAPATSGASPGVDTAKREAVGKPATGAQKKAKRSFVDPGSAPRDRSWASDGTRREAVAMSAEHSSKRRLRAR